MILTLPQRLIHKQMRQYAKFSGIAMQMGVIIFIGAYTGQWLDEKYGMEKKIYTMVLTLVSVVVALYLVLKQVIAMTKEDNKAANNQNETNGIKSKDDE